jgi:hypothetical protein
VGGRYRALEGPCVDLVARLRAAGRSDLAGPLSELLPSGDLVNSDADRPEMVRRLVRVADDAGVDESTRVEARRLSRIGKDLPSAIAGNGTVWIAWAVDEGRPWVPDWPTVGRYEVSWQGHGDDRDLLEKGPDMASLDEALEWARRRSARVIVRPSWDAGVHYWAGQGAPPADGRGPMPVLAGRTGRHPEP